MVIYFKKYIFAIAAIAIAVPVILSTIYPLMTGQLMASTLGGLLTMLASFFVSMFLAFNIFERKAEDIADGYLALYNQDCDPQALVDQGAQLAAAITYPCNEQGAWFMGYYAQALLDLGQADKTRAIEQGLKESMAALKKPSQKAVILVSMVQLAEKLHTPQESLALIQDGLSLLQEGTTEGDMKRREFLNAQKTIMETRVSGDPAEIVKLDEAVKTNSGYPMRVRVEYAFDEARAYYKLGDGAKERENLQFVVAHGNKLALVAQAQKRLHA